MKYAKPRIRSLNSNSASGYCGHGTGAASGGCTVGMWVGDSCAYGEAFDGACWDGGTPSTASMCALGTVPNDSRSRCVGGNGPA